MKTLLVVLQRIVIGLLTIPAALLMVLILFLALVVFLFIGFPYIMATGHAGEDVVGDYGDFVMDYLLPISWLDAWAKRLG